MINLATVCQQLPPVGHVLVWFIVLVWEYGLGKTKYGSSVGLFIEAPINSGIAFIKTKLGLKVY